MQKKVHSVLDIVILLADIIILFV